MKELLIMNNGPYRKPAEVSFYPKEVKVVKSSPWRNRYQGIFKFLILSRNFLTGSAFFGAILCFLIPGVSYLGYYVSMLFKFKGFNTMSRFSGEGWLVGSATILALFLISFGLIPIFLAGEEIWSCIQKKFGSKNER